MKTKTKMIQYEKFKKAFYVPQACTSEIFCVKRQNLLIRFEKLFFKVVKLCLNVKFVSDGFSPTIVYLNCFSTVATSEINVLNVVQLKIKNEIMLTTITFNYCVIKKNIR